MIASIGEAILPTVVPSPDELAGVTVKRDGRGEQNILHNDMESVTLLPISAR